MHFVAVLLKVWIAALSVAVLVLLADAVRHEIKND